MFDDYPTYPRYRSLKVQTPPLVGEDVYALQGALNFLGDFKVPLTPDGVFGIKTGKALVNIQNLLAVTPDGITSGGGQTQRAIALAIGKQLKLDLPAGLPAGQVAHESSFVLGNYSEPYPDRSYDAGVVQRNTNFTLPSDGFEVADSIRVLCLNVSNAHTQYYRVGGLRAWQLATGHWNAPAYANQLAFEEGAGNIPRSDRAFPSDESRAKLEAYMESCCAFVQL